jgi:hypothetical protein
MKKYAFNHITFEDLLSFVDIRQFSDDEQAFESWFSFQYDLSEKELDFLNKLIKRTLRSIDYYSEEELKAKAIIPLLNQVDFQTDSVQDWYERPLRAVINQVLLNGKTDYMIASGVENPQKPYFFIQEYKKILGDNHPKNPLFAEMMAAIENNQQNKLYGAFVIGRFWKFAIVEKLKDWEYNAYISKDFIFTDLNHLKSIYKNLQFIKQNILQGKVA